MNTITSAVFFSLLAAQPSAEINAPPTTTTVHHCQVFLIKDVNVAAQDTGLLISVATKAGDHVTTDQLLSQIDDRHVQLQKLAAELERDSARVRADDDFDIKFSIKSFELAEAELNQDLDINRKRPGTIPVADVRRKRLAVDRAQLQIERSRLDQKVARMDAEVKTAAVEIGLQSIQQRQILSPFDGEVVEVYRQAGDWVEAGEPIARVVQMDRLRVDGFIDSSQFTVGEVADRQVRVEIELARGRKEYFRGRIVFVNPLVQAGNRYRIQAEVDNRKEDGHWLLNPGKEATMVIALD